MNLMRGRRPKLRMIDHVVGTRLTDERYQYLTQSVKIKDCSAGQALRELVESCRLAKKGLLIFEEE